MTSCDNKDKQQFRLALQDVYRSYSELRIFVSDAINHNLAEIVSQTGLKEATFELIDWTEAKGNLDRLFAAFRQENPHHPFAQINSNPNQTLNPNPAPNPMPNPTTTINTQGGDYYEINNSGTYAAGNIDNRRIQQGINANDNTVINIKTIVVNPPHENPPIGDTPIDSDPPANATMYISHHKIEAVCQVALTQPGSLICIKAPHRFGKTELIGQLCQFAEGENYNVATIDLNALDANALNSLDQFLRWFCKRITQKLGNHKRNEIPALIDEYWDDELGSNTSCTDYLEEVVLDNLDQPLVLVLDNLDALFEYKAIVLDFFKLLRSWYEAARHNETWRNFRQVVAYSTEPYQSLGIPKEHSPLNVGEPIELPAFDRPQVEELVEKFGLTGQIDLDRLYFLLDGHPELLQLGLKFLRLDKQRAIGDLETEMQKVAGVFSSHLNGLETLLRRNNDYLGLMRQIARATEPLPIAHDTIDRDGAIALVRFGLVREVENRSLVPRCELYRRHFRNLA